jgi:hypothetical protein
MAAREAHDGVRGLLQDLRYAIRQFLKSPGFAVGAVVSLMLGVGATTILFSVVYGVVLEPFPYKDANRIVYFELLNKSGRYQPIPVNGGQFDAIRGVSGVEDVFFQQPGQFKNLTGDSSPIAVNAGSYSPNMFIFLGVPPFLGRVFTPADAPGGNPAPVAVLSFHFWQQHYFGSRDVIRQDPRNGSRALYSDRRDAAPVYLVRFRRVFAGGAHGRCARLLDGISEA